MNDKIKQQLLKGIKLGGQLGFNNKYITGKDLLQESLSVVKKFPEFTNKEDYIVYLDNLAKRIDFYKKLAHKYNIDEDKVELRFLSDSNLYNLLLHFEKEL